jgi:electron transfer flavoprotein alpha subunit
MATVLVIGETHGSEITKATLECCSEAKRAGASEVHLVLFGQNAQGAAASTMWRRRATI